MQNAHVTAPRHQSKPPSGGFSQRLLEATQTDQEQLLALPFVRSAMTGDLDLETYLNFLSQAYHHVKHTVPLLMATGAAMPERLSFLRSAITEYIVEEQGHEEWILDDIVACGGDAQAVRHGQPDLPAEIMVAFAYDMVQRRQPLGFFGMVHVLEGTSVKGATSAAQALQTQLGLPPSAFTYLTTHGDLDQDHTRFFATLMDGIEDTADQACVLHSARAFYRLYGDIFRALKEA